MVAYRWCSSTYFVSMSKKTFLFIVIFTGLLGGLGYFEYQYYRMPILVDAGVETEKKLVTVTNERDAIPAILDPQFESVASADVYLDDAGYGIVIEVASRVRFYPYQIIVWHQLVNDIINTTPLLVTYDPLCNSALAYTRNIEGEELRFGVSGKLWNNNTVMYDTVTDSLWSQLTGEAIEGLYTNTKLSRYPSTLMTWSEFKSTFASGQVLSRDTGYRRDYTQNPYEHEGYSTSPAIWFPLDPEDDRLSPKSLVFGVEKQSVSAVFPVDSWAEFDTIRSQLQDDTILLPSYWFCWAAMHPGTEIYSLTP